MSKARLIITAVVLEGRSQTAVARDYGVSKGWVSKLVARYRAEGETAFDPRSRRPNSSPNAIPATTVEMIIVLRRQRSRGTSQIRLTGRHPSQSIRTHSSKAMA